MKLWTKASLKIKENIDFLSLSPFWICKRESSKPAICYQSFKFCRKPL